MTASHHGRSALEDRPCFETVAALRRQWAGLFVAAFHEFFEAGSVREIGCGAYPIDPHLLLHPRRSLSETPKDRLVRSIPWTKAHFQKPTPARTFVDRILQAHQHGHELPIREHKTAIPIFGAGHHLDGMERNGWKHTLTAGLWHAIPMGRMVGPPWQEAGALEVPKEMGSALTCEA